MQWYGMNMFCFLFGSDSTSYSVSKYSYSSFSSRDGLEGKGLMFPNFETKRSSSRSYDMSSTKSSDPRVVSEFVLSSLKLSQNSLFQY